MCADNIRLLTVNKCIQQRIQQVNGHQRTQNKLQQVPSKKGLHWFSGQPDVGFVGMAGVRCVYVTWLCVLDPC